MPKFKVSGIPSSAPPHNVRRTRDVYRVEPRRNHVLWVLSHRIFSFDTHYIAKRTMVCLGANGTCDVDHECNPPHWQGWVCVLCPKDGHVYYLSLTPLGAEGLITGAKKSGFMRGLELHVWRRGDATNSQMLSMVQHALAPRPNLPPSRDVPKFLERLWSLPTGAIATEDPEYDGVNLAELPQPQWSREQLAELWQELRSKDKGAKS